MIHAFDDYLLDQNEFILTHQQQVIPLEPKVFDVLAYLIEQRERIISKDELIETFWPERVISDATLNTCIRSIRRALNDDHKQQKYIRTIPKRGFQFVGTLNGPPADSELTVNPELPTTPSSAFSFSKLRKPHWVLLGLFSLIVCLFIFIKAGNKPVSAIANGALSDKTTLAVLDFQSNTQAKEPPDYFTEGLTEELIANLARYRELFVIARNSSALYTQQNDWRETGKTLGAEYIVTGKVHSRNNKLSIRVNLINSVSGQQVWSADFEANQRDLLTLENELAYQIAGQVVPEVVRADVEQNRKVLPENLDAWALYHKARAIQAVFTPENQQKAIEWAQLALSRDPAFAAAYGIIARAKGVQFFYQWTEDEAQTLKEAIGFAEKAIELNDHDPNGFAALGYVYRYTGDETRSISNLERAVMLNPSDANIRLEFAHTLDWFRHQQRALPEINQAILLSPRDSRLQNMYFYKAHILFHLFDFEAALLTTEKMSGVLTTDTWRMYYQLMRAANFAQLDKSAEARQSTQQALLINPKISLSAMRKKFEGSKNHPDNRKFWLESLAKAGLPES